MTYCLAVFKSRSQAIDCRGMLARADINAALINTPSALKVGCGLSVRIPTAALARAKGLIARAGYTQFYGYMNI